MPSRTLTALVTLCAFCAALLWPRGASAQAPDPAAGDPQLLEARRHFEAGKNLYNAGDFAGAIREFKVAESVRPSPVLDYNIGLASERLHKRRVAVKYYQRYLQGAPNAPNRAEVEARIADLSRGAPPQPATPEQNPVEQPGDAPPPGPPQPAPNGYDPYAQSPEAQPVMPPPQPSPHRSYWWIPLVVVGGVVLIASIVLIAIYVPGSSSISAAADRGLLSPPRAPASPLAPSPAGGLLFRF